MNEPIRVLCVVTQMNRGGLENRLMDIYRNIDRKRIQVDFYTCRKERGQYDDEILSLGGRVYYNDPLSVSRLYKIPRRFADFFRQHPEYNIVHAQMNQWCGLILKGAKRAGVPVRIAHSLTALENDSFKNTVKNIIKLPVNRYATHRFAVSGKAGRWLFGDKAMEHGKVEVWPNAIDCGRFVFDEEIRASVRCELDLNNSFTLIHVGNSRPVKNHGFLLQVFASLLNKESNSRLVLVGEGVANGTLRQQAASLGIADKVIFLGLRDDVPRLLQAGDVFVFPSFYEGLPGAVMEAQAASLPCFISDSITNEVCITPLVEQMPLSLSSDLWAEQVLARRGEKRESTREYFEATGFDVHSLVEKLTDFYERVGRDRVHESLAENV